MVCRVCGCSLDRDVAAQTIADALILTRNPEAQLSSATENRLFRDLCWVCVRLQYPGGKATRDSDADAEKYVGH